MGDYLNYEAELKEASIKELGEVFEIDGKTFRIQYSEYGDGPYWSHKIDDKWEVTVEPSNRKGRYEVMAFRDDGDMYLSKRLPSKATMADAVKDFIRVTVLGQ